MEKGTPGQYLPQSGSIDIPGKENGKAKSITTGIE